jgi:hypothetical protein
MFEGYISLASVTLCRLGGPVVFIYGAPGGRHRAMGTVPTRTTRLPRHERPGSPQGVAVQPLPNALLRVEQAEHITPADGVSAEVTRPPEDGDIALPEAEAQFRAGSRRNVLPDDDGVEGATHEGCL